MPGKNQDFVVSCDWGSTSFRLRLVNRHTLDVLAAIKNADGITNLHQKWQSSAMSEPVSKERFYLDYLTGALENLSGLSSICLHENPIVISGMASSSIGIKALEYASLPFPLDGNGVIIEWLAPSIPFDYQVLLLSGVRSHQDVMRGEETQLLGRISLLNEKDHDRKKLFIFPGTHSKHIHVEGKMMIAFNTYMSGELFFAMSQHSVLKESVAKSLTVEISSEDEKAAFREGLMQSGKSHLLNSLFSVRIQDLNKTRSKAANWFYLSGIIIGAELRNISAYFQNQVVICSEGKLYELYRTALLELELSSDPLMAEEVSIETATAAGHILLLEKHLSRIQ